MKIGEFNKIIICIVFVTILMSNNVKAAESETTGDLFRLYNAKQEENRKALDEEYEKAKVKTEISDKKLEAAENDYKKVYDLIKKEESYNRMYANAQQYKKKRLASLTKDIDVLCDKNVKLAEGIGSSISADWDQLLAQDAEYKANLDQINQMLKEREKYTLTEKIEIDYTKLDKLKNKIKKEKQDVLDREKQVAKEVQKDLPNKYGNNGGNTVIGNVQEVRIPLSKKSLITSMYGERIDPITKQSVRFHSGLDLRAAMGTEVQALFHGVITGTGYSPLGGYFVNINHGDGVTTYYCHLSEIRCVVGQEVKQYEKIALSGNSGARTTGPHLHLGLYFNGNSVDPGIMFQ